MINSSVTSRLDYCNSLLYGINGYLVSQLQRCQNNAVCIVSLRRKYDHITPVVKDQHWLSVEQRINYIICCWPTRLNMAWPHLTCHHYCRPTNLGGLWDPRVNISWRHLVIAWKVFASVASRMLPIPFGTRSPSPSSVPSPLTLSRVVWRYISLMLHIHNATWHYYHIVCIFPATAWCLSDIISALEHGDVSLLKWAQGKTDIIIIIVVVIVIFFLSLSYTLQSMS